MTDSNDFTDPTFRALRVAFVFNAVLAQTEDLTEDERFTVLAEAIGTVTVSVVEFGGYEVSVVGSGRAANEAALIKHLTELDPDPIYRFSSGHEEHVTENTQHSERTIGVPSWS